MRPIGASTLPLRRRSSPNSRPPSAVTTTVAATAATPPPVASATPGLAAARCRAGSTCHSPNSSEVEPSTCAAVRCRPSSPQITPRKATSSASTVPTGMARSAVRRPPGQRQVVAGVLEGRPGERQQHPGGVRGGNDAGGAQSPAAARCEVRAAEAEPLPAQPAGAPEGQQRHRLRRPGPPRRRGQVVDDVEPGQRADHRPGGEPGVPAAWRRRQQGPAGRLGAPAAHSASSRAASRSVCAAVHPGGCATRAQAPAYSPV